MKRTRITGPQFIGILAEHEVGAKCADLCRKQALLHKSAECRGSPFPGRTYPTASVTGMPSAV